ncbi:MAG TPA: hypothetical protein ENJ08_07955 [Gammaproteobacteria bacterium]|nr:hypothetical protein [Gammaproteobacteria bacterium]
MKKYLTLLLMFCIVPATQADSFFDSTVIGLAFINQSAEIEVSGTGQDVSFSESGSGLGLYIDKYYNQTYRVNATLSYVSYDNFDIGEIIFSADYLLPVNESLSFFGGGALGAATQKYSDASVSDSAAGAVYGLQAGAILYVNKYIMLEAGYRFRPTSIETELALTQGDISTVTDLSESYLSLLLMF